MAVQDKKVEEKRSVTIRFCGDSGDGMQLTGGQFTMTSALAGNDISTFPNFPAEIRAPQGTLAGVSGFQLHFSADDIHTPGDNLDVLIAMNPAALKTNLADLEQNGTLIVNEDSFTDGNLKKAGYSPDEDIFGPLESKYRVCKVGITKQTMLALENSPLMGKDKERCKNFFALGLAYWMYSRPLEPTMEWLESKFSKKPEIFEANVAALKAGYNFGNTCELFQTSYTVPKAKIKPGTYRNITGNVAVALGFVAAAELTKRPLFIGSYPITPATDVLQELAKYKHYGVRTFQAEDEIAAIGSAIGAAFAGNLAITSTSGPGVCLKSEFMNLAMIAELPLVIINLQRGGPSTGLPTKSEQTDLLQALYGRNGESPMPIVASKSPSDCFDCAIEAARIATQYMTPVVLLSDGQLANGSEPWVLPDVDKLPDLEIKLQGAVQDSKDFMPYARDEKLARPWAIPGTKNCEHTLGGLEKENITGKVNLSHEVHEEMVGIRAQKVANIADSLPKTEIYGEEKGDLLILGWGSTYGSIRAATERLLEKGHKVGQVHLRHINPFPNDLGDILKSYKTVLMPELNSGQCRMLLRAQFLMDIKGFNKLDAKPINVGELVEAAEELL